MEKGNKTETSEAHALLGSFSGWYDCQDVARKNRLKSIPIARVGLPE
jgi:hypothetical protein